MFKDRIRKHFGWLIVLYRILRQKDVNNNKTSYYLSIWPSKTKYMIFRYTAPLGIAVIIRKTIWACEYAKRYGFIPIIDYEWEYFYDVGKIGEEDLFSGIFLQRKSVKEALQEKNVCVMSVDYCYEDKDIVDSIFLEGFNGYNIHELNDWRQYFYNLNTYMSRNFFFVKEFEKKMITDYNSMWPISEKVLGVSIREEFTFDSSDISGTCLELHPRNTNVVETAYLVNDYMKNNKIQYCFVAAQCSDTFSIFKEILEGEIIGLERMRPTYDIFLARRKESFCLENNCKHKEWYEYTKVHDEINYYKPDRIRDYCEEIWLLSKCDSLIAHQCGATYIALGWNAGKYEDYIQV